jgi:hypothetical protein
MNETAGTVSAPPWWAKRVRHGSLLVKRLIHLFTIVAAGVLWFLGDLYNLWLDWGLRVEGKIYSTWRSAAMEWLGYGNAPTEPKVFPLLGWLDFVGDLGFFFAVGWSLLWIYSDALCLAGDSAAASASHAAGPQNRKALKTFAKNTLLAASVAGASYLIAWQALKDSGQLRWLLQPNYAADVAAERLADPWHYVPSWQDVFWTGGLGKSAEIASDSVVAVQRTDAPPIKFAELSQQSKVLLYVICIVTICLASWRLLVTSIRPNG